MAQKVSLEGTECRASDCCGATINYNLVELGLGGEPKKNPKPHCIRCGKPCKEVVYVLVRKDHVSELKLKE